MQSRFAKRKIDRKRDFCLNCDFPMPDDYNFCPRCGQENIDNRAAIGMLAEEFINTFFAYDSRFLRSVIPFLFKPGFLTNQFLVGRRLSFVHPLRLYLVVSLLYFTVLSLQINVNGNVFQDNIDQIDAANKARIDSVNKQVKENLKKEGIRIGINELPDSVRKKTKTGEEGIVFNFGTKDTTGKDKGINLNKIKKWSKDRTMTPDAVLDSLGLQKNYWNRKLAEQSLKVVQRDTASLVEYFLGKTSLMMFLLLPFFALLLKLFYIRRKRYYIEHLVFTLHIHSFLFFLLSVVLLIFKIYDNDAIWSWSLLLLSIYLLLSFRNVYHQGWFKTLFKLFLLFIFYVVSGTFFLVGTVIVSFLLF